MASNQLISKGVVARNRKARHEYYIEDTVEAGIQLVGTEVKSLRSGRGSLNEAFAEPRDGDIYLMSAHIPEYGPAGRFNHEPVRPRKLLLHKREIDRLLGAVKKKGSTLIPLSLYFNDRGIAKVELALARGKKLHDKRATEKERDWNRQKQRILQQDA
ncbi:MAG: SsrA-binding protein [Rhodospirillaceae bacterium]|nr:SsrA-binding protein [Rhodospirillaceae bacterium]